MIWQHKVFLFFVLGSRAHSRQIHVLFISRTQRCSHISGQRHETKIMWRLWWRQIVTYDAILLTPETTHHVHCANRCELLHHDCAVRTKSMASKRYVKKVNALLLRWLFPGAELARGVRGSGPPQPRPGPLTGYVQIRRVFFRVVSPLVKFGIADFTAFIC